MQGGIVAGRGSAIPSRSACAGPAYDGVLNTITTVGMFIFTAVTCLASATTRRRRNGQMPKSRPPKKKTQFYLPTSASNIYRVGRLAGIADKTLDNAIKRKTGKPQTKSSGLLVLLRPPMEDFLRGFAATRLTHADATTLNLVPGPWRGFDSSGKGISRPLSSVSGPLC